MFDTRGILTSPASDVHERLKSNGSAIKITKRLLTINNKTKIIRWNIYRDNNFHSRRQILKCLWKSLFTASGCLLFSKMNSRQENRSKLKDLDESTPEPAIRSGDTGQRILCFDSCQLITTLMYNMCAISVFLCSQTS